jgi:hypothetical protein
VIARDDVRVKPITLTTNLDALTFGYANPLLLLPPPLRDGKVEEVGESVWTITAHLGGFIERDRDAPESSELATLTLALLRHPLESTLLRPLAAHRPLPFSCSVAKKGSFGSE